MELKVGKKKQILLLIGLRRPDILKKPKSIERIKSITKRIKRKSIKRF